MKTILITGGNRGIGKAIALSLSKQNYKVIIVSRDENKGQEVVNEINKITNNNNIYCLQGDLSSINKCYQLAEDIKKQFPDINVLINNAGVWMTKKEINEDGLELSFMVNYLAPFILSTNLLNLLKQNSPSRIVNVNAGLYFKGSLEIDKTPYGKDFHKIRTYANTKLCSTMFNLNFSKQLEGTGVTINAVHPGVINTGLGDFSGILGTLLKFIKKFWKSPEFGAESPVWLATSKDLEYINGKYFNLKEEIPYSENALDENLRNKLYENTIELLKNKLP